MSQPPSDRDPVPPEAFDLNAPSRRGLARGKSAARPAGTGDNPIAVPPPPDTGDYRQRPLAWKGFEEEEQYHPDVEFEFEHKSVGEDMDMTPMVDVTFLLLIFFMVTASFASQRAAEPPPNTDELPSKTVVQPEDQADFVEVIIDQNNTYRITSRDYEEVEAPSDIQMRAELRDAKEALNARKLLITAHEEAWHERVVKVLDYGQTLGFEEYQIKTTQQEY